MQLPPPDNSGTLEGVASWARRLIGGIVGPWRREHDVDGRHTFAYVSVPYAANRYSGGAGTWGVGASDQALLLYRIVGDECRILWRINTTDVGGTTAILYILLPAGIRASARGTGWHYYSDAGTEGGGLARLTADLTRIELFKSDSSSTWTATTADDTYTEGTVVFPITV